MLYIIEPGPDSDKVEAVGLPNVNFHYGDNSVTYSNDEETVTLCKDFIVDCNGVPGTIKEVLPMKFGRVILSVHFVDSTPKTTTGALMR